MNTTNVNNVIMKKKVATKQDIPKNKVSKTLRPSTPVDVETIEQERVKGSVYDPPSDGIVRGSKVSFLKNINSASFLERRKMDELETGKSYLIECIERVTTKFGDALLTTLDDEDERFKVFLPKRFNTKLTDEDLEYMNNETFYMKYLGGKYHDLEFE